MATPTRDPAKQKRGSIDLATSLAMRAHVTGYENRIAGDGGANEDGEQVIDANGGVAPGALTRTATGKSRYSIQVAAGSSTRAPRRLTLKDVRPSNYRAVNAKDGLPVIRDSSELTAEWLTLVFRKRKYLEEDGQIVEIKKKSIGEGQGEYGDLSLLTIVKATGAKPTLPVNLIAKMCPQSANLPMFMLKGIYLNEAHFYNDFSVEGGGLPRPECYHVAADISASPPKFCFLIENAFLGAMGGDGQSLQYQRVDGISNVRHMEMVMDGLAKFHARWWGSGNKKPPMQWAMHPLINFLGLGRNAVPVLTKQAFKLLPQLMRDEVHPDGTPVTKWGAEYAPILKWRKPLMKRLRWVTKQLLRPPLTLCHCDSHLENIFFHERYAGGAAFIDFGNMRFQHALSDVAFFLGTCLEPEVRREHEMALLKRYWQQLVASGDVTDYSWSLCQHDYRMQHWCNLMQAIMAAPAYLKQRKQRAGMFAKSPKKSDQMQYDMYAAYNRRCAAALVDHDWISVVADAGTSCCPYFCCGCCCCGSGIDAVASPVQAA